VSLRRVAHPDALAWNADGLVPVVVQEIASGAVLMLAWADREAVRRTLGTGEGWFWSRSRRALWRKGATSGNTLAVAEVAVDCDGDALLYRVDATGPACHTGARSCFEAAADASPETEAVRQRLDEGERRGRNGRGEDAASASSAAPERLDEEGGGRLERGEQGRAEAGGAAGRPDDGGEAPRSDGASAVAGAGVVAGGATAGAGLGSQATTAGPRLELGWLWDVLVERAAADPAASYTARLLAAGVDRIARKVGEEATEVVIAALRSAPASPRQTAAHVPPPAGSFPEPRPSVGAPPLAAEAADLLYHLLVLLLATRVPPDEVAHELRRRHARPSTPASPKPEDAAVPPAGAAPTAKAPASPSPKPEDRP
jgi:phosphoribosyl-AMP cyclohydrolase / phosphoribosyl-ATP pyrophosphohydrolase